MNSKTTNNTEEKAVFEFFKSLEGPIDAVNREIKGMKEKIEYINALKKDATIPDIDVDLPNLAITLNNKLVEYYQYLKEKNIVIFNMGKDGENIETYFAPYTIMSILKTETQYAVDQTINNGFLKRFHDMEEHKEKNWEKIEKGKSVVVRKINEIIWDTKIIFNKNAINELFFSKEEIEELRIYLEQYKEFDSLLSQCDFEKQLSELIIDFFETVDFTEKQKQQLLETEIKEFLKELKKEELYEEIEKNVIKEEKQNSWELTESEKRKIQSETLEISRSVQRENDNKNLNIEVTK